MGYGELFWGIRDFHRNFSDMASCHLFSYAGACTMARFGAFTSFGVQYPSFGVHSSLFLAFFCGGYRRRKKMLFFGVHSKRLWHFLRPLSRPQKNDFKRVRAGLRRWTIAKSRTVRFKQFFTLWGLHAVYNKM